MSYLCCHYDAMVFAKFDYFPFKNINLGEIYCKMLLQNSAAFIPTKRDNP